MPEHDIKRRASELLQKGRLSEAIRAFADPERKVRLNQKHSATEMRYYCLGAVDGQVMTVRFTVRQGRVRIIGAGYWREGRKMYEQG